MMHLKENNFSLKYELTIWKNKFLKIIYFIKNRLTRWQDKEKYQKFTNDLLHNGAIDYDIYEDMIMLKMQKAKMIYKNKSSLIIFLYKC